LLSSEVWIAAISQIFFTLSLAFGIMVAYASYKGTREDVAKDSYITSFVNSGISLFAGFVVFGIIGFMATQTGSPIDEVAASGPGLAFVVFPEALSLMPLAAFFSIVFFLTLLSLGIDSAFSLVEAVNTAISDADTTKRWKKYKLSFFVCLLAFLAGIIFTTRAGLYFLDIVDHFVTNYNLVLVGILQALLVGWIYGADKLRRFINEVSDFKTGKWWNWAIKYVIPIALIVLLATQFWNEVQTPYEGYPAWALAIGWAVVAIPLLIFIWFFVKASNKTVKA
jgi:NSS family neurotransmitter:Na+ symporter